MSGLPLLNETAAAGHCRLHLATFRADCASGCGPVPHNAGSGELPQWSVGVLNDWLEARQPFKRRTVRARLEAARIGQVIDLTEVAS
jgi:hypothetical protein